MAEHGTCVPEAQVDIGTAVGIGQGDATRFTHEERVGCAPVDHPMHRDAVEPVFRRLRRKGLRLRGALGEAFTFASKQCRNTLSVYAGNGG